MERLHLKACVNNQLFTRLLIFFIFRVCYVFQIPLSCIARATEMGVWLEELVTRRARRKSREQLLQEASGNGLELERSQCFQDMGETEERINAYEEFLLFLKAAICAADDIMGKGCHQFNQARSMAMNLLGR